MKRTVRGLAFSCVLGGLVFMWSAQGGQDEVVAQQSVPTVTSMYTGPDGLTHFKEVPMPVGFLKVAGVQFSDRRGAKPNPNPNWGRGPHRRYAVTLSGRAEIEASDGTRMVADRDHIVLVEDLTGKGHITKGIDWVVLFVEIDQPRQAQSSN